MPNSHLAKARDAIARAERGTNPFAEGRPATDATAPIHAAIAQAEETARLADAMEAAVEQLAEIARILATPAPATGPVQPRRRPRWTRARRTR